MTEDILTKRAYVAGMYPGPRWKEKVKKMSDVQVIAIYLRENNKPPKNNKPKESASGGSGGDDIPF